MLRKTHRFRIVLLIVFSMLTFAAIEWRLYDIQIRQHATYLSRADHQQHRTFMLAPRRGDILDRNNLLLAGSYFTESIILDTRKQKGKPDPQFIQDLSRAVGKPVSRIRDLFDNPQWCNLYPKASDDVIQAVAAIESRNELPKGLIAFETSSKREYPNASLASHVLGFTTIDKHGSDNIGLAGLEKQYDSFLSGKYQEVSLPVSSGLRRRGLAAFDDEAIEATFGRTLQLTIDQRIQMLAEAALSRSVGRFQAKGGVAIVMDVTTGEILAMANCPDYDLNSFRTEQVDRAQLRNRALTDPIEVGSVMKTITATMLLDRGLVSLDEMVDCKGGSAWIGGRVIKDTHHSGVVDFRTAFAESSNVVMAGLADSRLEPNVYYQGLTRFGLGAPTGIDLPGEGSGIFRPVERWTSMSRASLAIGYEAGLTPMQVIAALGAIGNNGWRMRPHMVREIRGASGEIVQRIRPEPIGRVCSSETSRMLLELMEQVVLRGTAQREGGVPGYRVGGKTGTTVKHDLDENGKKLYIASFAGLAPIDNPKLAIYCYIDEPHGAKYGGDVAAPVFREIVEEALPLLGIAPTDPQAYEIAQAQRREAGPAAFQAAALLDAATSATEIVDAMPLDPADIQPMMPGIAPPKPKTGPAMPDCRGMTMVEAWDALAAKGIEARMLGSGVCVSQEPRPGARLEKDEMAKVIFAHDEAPAIQESTGAALAPALR